MRKGLTQQEVVPYFEESLRFLYFSDHVVRSMFRSDFGESAVRDRTSSFLLKGVASRLEEFGWCRRRLCKNCTVCKGSGPSCS